MTNRVTRRNFLVSTAALGGIAVGSSALAACGGNEESGSSTTAAGGGGAAASPPLCFSLLSQLPFQHDHN